MNYTYSTKNHYQHSLNDDNLILLNMEPAIAELKVSGDTIYLGLPCMPTKGGMPLMVHGCSEDRTFTTA